MSHNPLSNHPDLIPGKGYGFTGKLMLSAIVMLTTVVVIMVCFHIYARWYIIRERRRRIRRRHRNRNRLVFYADINTPNLDAVSRGLDATVVGSLPVLLYSHETHLDMPECAVCLSEFEENEKVRLLPKCNHGFHIECIDMWFHSHSTCPLCRSKVEHVLQMKDFVVSVGEVPGASATVSGCHYEEVGCSSSLGGRRTAFNLERVTIEIPRTTYESGDELRSTSPATQELKLAAGTRLKTFKSMLSLNRKRTPVSPSSPSGVGTSREVSASVLDVECGRNEATRGQNSMTSQSRGCESWKTDKTAFGDVPD